MGNCQDLNACREFCKIGDNRTVCTDFAIKKKLKKTRYKSIAAGVLRLARQELGCDSTTNCHNFCRKEENRLICKSFGEKHELIKKAATPSAFLNADLWKNTVKELGCKDELSCKNFCKHPDNLTKCKSFAVKHLSKQEKLEPKLIQTKEKEAYCKLHPEDCPGFKVNSDTPYIGPAGCKTEQECSEYCKANPGKCPNFPEAKAKPDVGFGEIKLEANPANEEPEEIGDEVEKENEDETGDDDLNESGSPTQGAAQ